MIKERKDARLALALAAGANVPSAARRAGVSRRTVFRRLQDPSFCRAVGAARGQILTRATARLARTSTKAVDTLHKLLDDESASVRRTAAKSLLDSLARLTDLAEVEQRIAELETAVGECPGFPGEVAMRTVRNGSVPSAAQQNGPEEEEDDEQEEEEPEEEGQEEAKHEEGKQQQERQEEGKEATP
jgi:hypothetical protein